MLHTEPFFARSAVQGNRSPTSATITFPPPLTDRAARLSLHNSIFYAVLVSNSKNMRIKSLIRTTFPMTKGLECGTFNFCKNWYAIVY